MSSLKTKADQSRLPGGPGTTTLDDFLGGRISVVQPKAGHRAGSDAVWLQAAVPACAGERVLDAGAGVGVAGLCLLSRCPQINVTAVDIDEEACALAEANAARNGFSGQFQAITADLTAPAESLLAKGLVREGYDQVFANPPFHAEGTVRAASNAGRAEAHIMREGALEAWIRSLATFAAPKGRLILIHRPEALPDLLPLLDRRFGAITLFPLFPKEGEPALRIILQARKGSRAELRLLRGQVLHQADGRYTEKAEAVLRHGEALELSD
ncbi:MAG TPA: methyltransferase [Methyloceanibacter sp.]|jgi:tRNA1(Val) A37 N6-methylase TrmN6|nr:methyltransferase [Methyloceanibacter sp.]